MSGTTLAAIVAIVAIVVGYMSGMAGMLFHLGRRLDQRMDRLEDRLSGFDGRLRSIELEIGKIGQRLDDHITHHPGPGAAGQLVQR